MAQRRSPQHRLPATPFHHSSHARRKYQLRTSPASRKRTLSFASSHGSDASDTTPRTPRPVLVPLHPNLRRLPSRLLLVHKEGMRDASQNTIAQVGTKRKRVVSGNENAHAGGRMTRGGGRYKRQKSDSRQESSGEDEEEMEVDNEDRWIPSHHDSDEENDTSDEYLVNDAAPRQLLRLRKDELVRLYSFAGLAGDPEVLTKQDIVQALVAAREDYADIPPSSPRGDGASSGYSSDDGNDAGGEETDFGGVKPGFAPNGLRRRVTVQDIPQTVARPLKGRSLSLGFINPSTPIGHVNSKKAARFADNISSPVPHTNGVKRRNTTLTHSRSSPLCPTTSSLIASPVATRLRTRKNSSAGGSGPSSGSVSALPTRSKGKGKQVEFSAQVVTLNGAPHGSESELTELDEADANATPKTVSPRRLRSKDRKSTSRTSANGTEAGSDEELSRRVTPARKAKGKVGSLKEDDEDEAAEENGEEEEVDELMSSPSPSPHPPSQKPGRHTPVKRRLRPRKAQAEAAASDGDDEGEDDEQEEEGEGEEGSAADEEEDEEEEDRTEVELAPRRLRNGKVVGDDDMEEDICDEDEDDDDDEEEEEEEEEEDVEDDANEDDIDYQDPDEVDAEGESEETEEPMEDDVDLTIATAKTLVRLRRDDLVRLCETRDLDVDGTKPQLVEALLQWRDQQADTSSPSSTTTVRPPSTTRARRKRSRSQTPPVLLRSDRVHTDEPRTPPVSLGKNEQELELDLESLGLEDREIPPDKLTKLEKIGSGGFKDVFIGKFKGRKVAIAEFRGQLSSMDIKELKLLGAFDHPNVVRFLGVSIPENTKETPVMIVSELCSNGDLFDYIRNVPPPSLHKVMSIMLDIARGLEYLHLCKPSVIHRDCKSSNILITARGNAKIADFGLAKVKQSTRSMVRSLVGTVNWQAPELWHAHPKYNHKVDVFSCALVFWETLQWHQPVKKFPWEGMNEHAIYEIVGAKRQRPSLTGLRRQWCPEVVDLIERMWAHEHQDRPTMSEVVEELEQLVRR